MFSVAAKEIKDFFSVSHVQLMSRCTGTGKEHSQAASPSWPMEIFYTIDILLNTYTRGGWGAGTFS